MLSSYATGSFFLQQWRTENVYFGMMNNAAKSDSPDRRLWVFWLPKESFLTRYTVSLQNLVEEKYSVQPHTFGAWTWHGLFDGRKQKGWSQ
ncbi:hypothetical protein AVEN_209377-1 [Araneus ventricosus]|uniref:Uncharacterized protein n=1 Tax=Araneus ventricosus TaxID=182803 RepID=A0A4Y2WJC1_ARAVE|nr:hypothetical protein AVEN_245312-1 [Araneus ventricosus]GBO36708.1 hypothetical protein AVEN_106972-1 [Araneus ventricosus]GBO36714.1 hypothetical protein AVEN_180386-1 [Araneus ventricosus]GBO36716.1 hypothetical protein AVEN_209377-1 [Araneus ventricosus]